MAEQTKHQCCPSHCCAYHGCKYGYEDCPVVGGTVLQDHPCYQCPILQWENPAPSQYTAKIGPSILTLEMSEDPRRTVGVVTFLGKYKVIPIRRDEKAPHPEAKIAATLFAVALVEELYRAIDEGY